MLQYFDQTGTRTIAPRRVKFCPNCGNELDRASKSVCGECEYVLHPTALPGVAVLLTDSRNRILVERRRATPDVWNLPGGVVKANESFMDAAHREVREETGLRVRLRSVINVVSNLIRPHLESIVVVLVAEPLSGDARPGDDVVEIDWVNEKTMPRMAYEAERRLLREYYRSTLAEIVIDSRFAEREGG